jgi:hypothetical protein
MSTAYPELNGDCAGRGKGAKQEGDGREGYHEREETRRAASSAVEEAAAIAQKAQAHVRGLFSVLKWSSVDCLYSINFEVQCPSP